MPSSEEARRNFQRPDQNLRYVVAKEVMLLGDQKIQPGEEVDVRVFDYRRFRQLVQWRKIALVGPREEAPSVAQVITAQPPPPKATNRPRMSLPGRG